MELEAWITAGSQTFRDNSHPIIWSDPDLGLMSNYRLECLIHSVDPLAFCHMHSTVNIRDYSHLYAFRVFFHYPAWNWDPTGKTEGMWRHKNVHRLWCRLKDGGEEAVRRGALGKKQGLVKNTCVSIWWRGKFPSREEDLVWASTLQVSKKGRLWKWSWKQKEGGKVALDSPRLLSFLLCAAAY